MDKQIAERSEDILILAENPSLLKHTSGFISEQFPNANVTTTCTLEQCKERITTQDFDIVILDCDMTSLKDLGLVHHLKVRDKEPALLLITESVDPGFINDMSGLTCQRYLHKDGDWVSQLGPAVRQLIRIRKLEEENRRLVAQLTEAKMFLEEKNRRLDEFCATVAHDIRGPLGGVSMKLEFILDKYGGKLEDRLQLLLGRSLDTTRRLVDVVQAMYSYAKLGSKAAKMKELDLVQLFEDVIHDLSFDDSLQIKIGLGDLPKVWGSADLLRRVFINLISNAVKYCDKKEIIINIGFDGYIEHTLGTFARIYVSDNGPGIPDVDKEEVFSIFKRGMQNAKSEDGLGVGLSVVQRIIELHYGEVNLETELGKGSKFIFTLPIEKLDFLE